MTGSTPPKAGQSAKAGFGPADGIYPKREQGCRGSLRGGPAGVTLRYSVPVIPESATVLIDTDTIAIGLQRRNTPSARN